MADLHIPQGKTWRAAFPVLGDFDPEGWTLRSQVRTTPTSPGVLHEWSTALGTASFEEVSAVELTRAGYPTDVPQLCVVLRCSPGVSAAWGWNYGVYDIEASNGIDVLLVASGRIAVEREVTR